MPYTQIDSFVISWGCAQSKEAIQDHWLVDYSTVYRDKDANGASRNYGAVYQAITRQSAGVDTFVQHPSQN